MAIADSEITPFLVVTRNLIYPPGVEIPVGNLGKALQDLKAGRFVLIYDADGMEEETDMCIASQFVGPEAVRAMRKDAGGWICTTIPPKMLNTLDLPTLADLFIKGVKEFPSVKGIVPDRLPYDRKSSFSLTISHRKTYTGVTDIDRALTITGFAEFAEEAIRKGNGWAIETFAREFHAPGHVALLKPSVPLLVSRMGHTELTTAMAVMAGLIPSATICEMLGDDGKALSKAEAKKYAEAHNLAFLEGREILEAWRTWSE